MSFDVWAFLFYKLNGTQMTQMNPDRIGKWCVILYQKSCNTITISVISVLFNL